MRNWLALRLNALVNALPRPVRRFLLDRVVPASVARKAAAGLHQVVTLPSGAKMTVNPLLHGVFVGAGLRGWETERRAALAQHLKPGDCFWDIGANVGIFSLEAAAKGARAVMIEPEENNLVCLHRSVADNPELALEVHDVAVSDAPGEMQFDRRGGAFSGRLVDDRGSAVGSAVTVRVETISGLIAAGVTLPDLIKIDVEGGEGAVLSGAAGLLSERPPILFVELHWGFGAGAEHAIELMAAAGYTFRDETGSDLTAEQAQTDQAPFLIGLPAGL